MTGAGGIDDDGPHSLLGELQSLQALLSADDADAADNGTTEPPLLKDVIPALAAPASSSPDPDPDMDAAAHGLPAPAEPAPFAAAIADDAAGLAGDTLSAGVGTDAGDALLQTMTQRLDSRLATLRASMLDAMRREIRRARNRR